MCHLHIDPPSYPTYFNSEHHHVISAPATTVCFLTPGPFSRVLPRLPDDYRQSGTHSLPDDFTDDFNVFLSGFKRRLKKYLHKFSFTNVVRACDSFLYKLTYGASSAVWLIDYRLPACINSLLTACVLRGSYRVSYQLVDVIMDVSILNEQLEDERRTVAQLQKKMKDYQVNRAVFTSNPRTQYRLILNCAQNMTNNCR